jgi:DNA-binding PadR family transcriptional regulator
LSIHHAVLGLLADGPSYGYELKANFERAIGPQWGELNIGHLYQVLERLERDGLVLWKDVPQ